MNEISYQLQLLLNNGDLKDQFASSSIAADQAVQGAFRNTLSVNFAAHVALGIGDLSTPGFGVFQNLDDTNYVEVGIDVGGSFYPFLHLLPGEADLCRVAISALYAKANVAPVKLFYILYET
jgi:hypothetical protein